MKKIALILLILSFLAWGAKYVVRDLSKSQYKNSQEATRTAIIEEAISDGKKDFASVKPYTGITFEVTVNGDPFSYPYCDEIYENVPITATHPLEVCKEIRKTESCEYSYSEKSDITGFDFVIYDYDSGSEAYLMNNILDYWLYINGKCRLRSDN